MADGLQTSWDELFRPKKPVAAVRDDPKCACCDHPLSLHNGPVRTYCNAPLCCCLAFAATFEDVKRPNVVFRRVG
jgi:hypothetical protein